MTAITGLRVDVDGATTVLNLDHSEGFLQALYAATGGELVESVRVSADVEMWVDEEGLISGKQQQNPVGSAFYLLLGGRTPIMGPIVFLGAVDDEGWSTTLDPDNEKTLRAVAAEPDPYLALLRILRG